MPPKHIDIIGAKWYNYIVIANEREIMIALFIGFLVGAWIVGLVVDALESGSPTQNTNLTDADEPFVF